MRPTSAQPQPQRWYLVNSPTNKLKGTIVSSGYEYFLWVLAGCDDGTLILFMAMTRAIVSFKVCFYFERVIVKYGFV